MYTLHIRRCYSLAIPAVAIILYLPYLLPWKEVSSVPLLPYTHAVSCLAPWVGSVFYHVFLNNTVTFSKYVVAYFH